MNTLMFLMGAAVLCISMEVSFATLDLGDSCSENSHCGDAAGVVCHTYDGCTNGTCSCMADYMQQDDGTCKMKKMYDDDCNADTDVCYSPHDATLMCDSTTNKCACPTDQTWMPKQHKCFAADTYIVLDAACTTATAAQCYGHDSDNMGAYDCAGENDESKTCQCASLYIKNDAADKCWKKMNDEACTRGDTDDTANQECATSKGLECRAESDAQDAATKCLCVADTPNWHPKTHTCVDTSVRMNVERDGECTTNNDCMGELHCSQCPSDEDGTAMECRPVKTGGNNPGGNETGGAAQLAAGVTTIILSAVAMFL